MICILVLGTCFISPLFASDIFIPPQLAQTRDRAAGTNGKTVLLIEEAHVDYNAQKAVADLLEDLAQNERLRDIFVEGGWGDVSLTPLRSLTTPDRRKEIGGQYLKEGKISGDEYVSLVSDLDIRLEGIEDPALYEANMKVFLKFSEVRPELLGKLSEVASRISNLKSQILTPAMNELLDRRAYFDAQKISLLEYVQFLMKRLPPPQNGASPYPNLAKIMALAGKDGSFDPDKLAVEKTALTRALAAKLSKPELEGLRDFETQKTTEGELAGLDALLKKAESLKPSERPPVPVNLRAYRNALREIARMDTAVLFSELDRVFREELLALKPSPDQQALLETARSVRHLEKLFDLSLTEDEFKVQGPKFEVRTLNLEPSTLNFIEQWIPVAMSFYETARAREQAMIENLDREIQGRGLALSAVIAGGFHSRNIFDALKKKGYAVVLVAPRFTPADARTQHERYLEVLKNKWTAGMKSETRNPKVEVPRTKLQEPNNVYYSQVVFTVNAL